MGRPPLTIGTYGDISCRCVVKGEGKKPPKYQARARYRDRDGVIRIVTKYGQTKGDAKQALRDALADRQHDTGIGVRRTSTLTELAALWLDEIDGSSRATNTRETYRYAVDGYVKPYLGAIRVGEASTAIVDKALSRIEKEIGKGAAKTARSCLNGMFGLAIRHDALTVNPVREARSISSPRKQSTSLTRAQAEQLTDLMRSDARAILLDLPDLVDFGLATGCRIGEALAIRESVIALDFDEGTVEINATAIRVKGTGMVIQERPKTAAGWRVLALPPFAVAMLRRRRDELRLNPPAVQVMNPDDAIRLEAAWVAFPAPLARSVRDPSNTAGDLREVLDRLGCESCGGVGWHPALKTAKQNEKRPEAMPLCHDVPPFAWVTFHTFRKTVATRLDEINLTAREIADQMGHSQPSMTQDVYMGRKVVSAKAAAALDR